MQTFKLRGKLAVRTEAVCLPAWMFQVADHVGVPSKLTAVNMDVCNSETSQQCNHTSHNTDQMQAKMVNSKPHIENSEDNTFQCLVTVHREMSQ
jgi:hypothetical protein